MEEVKEGGVIAESLESRSLFDGIDIITKRPEGMEWKSYKELMKYQKKLIKKYLKGRYIHISRLYPTAEVLHELGFTKMPTTAEIIEHSKTPGNEMALLLIKGYTYEKDKAVQQ